MKRILVAEDEQNLREGIATAFRDRGWQVIEAGNGSERGDWSLEWQGAANDVIPPGARFVIGGARVVGHSVGFDLAFIEAALADGTRFEIGRAHV